MTEPADDEAPPQANDINASLREQLQDTRRRQGEASQAPGAAAPRSNDDPTSSLQEITARITRPLRVRRNPTARQRAAVLENQDLEQDIRFKRRLLTWALWATSLQIGATNAGVAAYAWANGGNAEPSVLLGWMSMTTVETIGVVAIIARYLFPDRSTAGTDTRASAEGHWVADD